MCNYRYCKSYCKTSDLPQQKGYVHISGLSKIKDFSSFFVNMDLRRVELLTSSLQMKCSSQLSYRPFSIWWAHQESNLGPQSYQDCALTS